MESLANIVRRIQRPLNSDADLDPLLERIDEARLVLLGEASHGTSEFYTWRDRITRRLIAEQGFSFIAVEGDWPDCYRVNRYVKGYDGAAADAAEVLGAFQRWPAWMWANREVQVMIDWLREHNRGRATGVRAGFYGLDVYSLWESMESVIGHLQRVDPAAVPAALEAYSCFEPYGRDERSYARATALVPASCEDEVVRVLTQLRRSAPTRDGDAEAALDAEQNALVAVNAERYYRAMVRADADSWNIRDRHMAQTLDRLLRFYGPGSRGVVWAHNTHIGDARATDMARDGMVNIGQLARETHADEGVVLVGFTSYRGTVVASHSWGAPMERMNVPPGREGSWEDVIHAGGAHDRMMILDDAAGEELLMAPRGHRAIGVVYHPEREHTGNYVPTVLPERYDVVLAMEKTRALLPLHQELPPVGELPETFPTGV